MIAKNFIRYPEALRFQVEMFSNGYKNSPRIMRLMTVIFKQMADVPQWFKAAASRAKALVKKWKKGQDVLAFGGRTYKPTGNPLAHRLYLKEGAAYQGPAGQTWSGKGQMPKWLSVRRDVFKEDIKKWLLA